MSHSFIVRTGWSPFKWPGEEKEAKQAHERVQALVSFLDSQSEEDSDAREVSPDPSQLPSKQAEARAEIPEIDLFPSMVPVGPSNFLQFRHLDSEIAKLAFRILGDFIFRATSRASITLVASSFDQSLGTPSRMARRFAEDEIEPRLGRERSCIIGYESVALGFALTVTELEGLGERERTSVADRIYIAETGQGLGRMPSLQDIRADEGRGRNKPGIPTNR